MGFTEPKGLLYYWDLHREYRWEWWVQHESERNQEEIPPLKRSKRPRNHRVSMVSLLPHLPHFSFISLNFLSYRRTHTTPKESHLFIVCVADFSHELSPSRWTKWTHKKKKNTWTGKLFKDIPTICIFITLTLQKLSKL